MKFFAYNGDYSIAVEADTEAELMTATRDEADDNGLESGEEIEVYQKIGTYTVEGGKLTLDFKRTNRN